MSVHDPERRALSRAAVVLLAVSVVRWAVASRSVEPAVPAGAGEVLAGHIAATDSAADEEERRSRPLEEKERLDPNVAPEVELDRLPGVGPATAAAIVAARDTAAFTRPEDLLSVRGIGPATLERIRPWVRMEPGARRLGARRREARRPAAVRAPPTRAPSASAATDGAAPTSAPGRSGPDGPVDVNRADAEALQELPGIGPALAGRIIDARAQGPFRSVDDLVRVRGIGPATLERLRGRVRVGGRHP